MSEAYCQGGQFQSVCFCPQRHFPTVVFFSSQKAYSSLDAEEGSAPGLWWPRSPPQLASIEAGEQTLRLPQSSLTHTGASLYRLLAVRVGGRITCSAIHFRPSYPTPLSPPGITFHTEHSSHFLFWGLLLGEPQIQQKTDSCAGRHQGGVSIIGDLENCAPSWTLTPSWALWDSWAQESSCVPHFLITAKRLYSTSINFPELQWAGSSRC